MEDIDAVVAKVEEYVRIIAGRDQAREAIRAEGAALLQHSMQQTQDMVARILKQADDTLETDARERDRYYGTQYQEKAASTQRLEAAAARRTNALIELRTVVEGRRN